MSITAVGPINIRNGLIESVGACTRTEVSLKDIKQAALEPPVAVAELQATKDYNRAKMLNRRKGQRQ